MKRRRPHLPCTVAALAIALLASGAARAQRGIDAELFHPALDSYGIFSVDRSEVSRQWDFGFKLFANYAGNPLRLTLSDDADPDHLRSKRAVMMERQVALDFGIHVGLTNWLELALDIPVSSESFTSAYGSNGSAADAMVMRTGFYRADPYTNVPPPNAAPLDSRVALKARIFQKNGFGMAAAALVTIPFGDDSAFLGDAGVTFRPELIADFTKGPFTVAVNAGAVVRQETRVFDPYDVSAGLVAPRLLLEAGDELTWSAGLAYRFVRWASLGAEAYGLIPLVGRAKDYTGDVLGGLQLFPKADLAIAVGAGGNVFASADRHDDFRVFLGVTWAPVAGKGGIGSGDLDTDHDGIVDSQDLCPDQPEDRDGFHDADGCPDPDNDRDGISDKDDKCPNEPEDRDGFQDEDGCPETDNDHDGIPDVQDKCPNDPEDMDGFQDDDGCPDLDNDGDGIPDSADKCPNEPETFNGVDDADGCPDSGGSVEIAHGKIEIPEQIQFETGRATVAQRSNALLDRIADKLKANPQIKRVRIEGNTDDLGAPKRNLALSQARAEAVRDYLIKHGVEADRLQAVGYGDTRPLDKRKTAEARAKNRRVELIIVEQ